MTDYTKLKGITPRPWLLEETIDKDGFPEINIFATLEDRRDLICMMNVRRVPLKKGFRKTPGGYENARAIAALPELIEDCKAKDERLATQDKRIKELEETLSAVCDEYEEEIRAHHPEPSYPCEERRLQRDLSVIDAYRKVLNGEDDVCT